MNDVVSTSGLGSRTVTREVRKLAAGHRFRRLRLRRESRKQKALKQGSALSAARKSVSEQQSAEFGTCTIARGWKFRAQVQLAGRSYLRGR
jgi:hypothetical protein